MTDEENTTSAAASSSAAPVESTTPAKKRGRPKRAALCRLCSPAMEPLVINFPATNLPSPTAQSEPDNSQESEENPGVIAATAT
jgi:hypothetical protein